MADSGGSQRGGGSGSRRNRNSSGGAAGAVLLALIGVVVVASRGADPPGPGLSAAKAAARKGHYDAAWQALSLTGGKAATDRTTQCAANSFGQVRDAFLGTPCQSLRRTLLAVRDTRANTAFVSIAWVSMANAAGARALKVIADRDGSGDIRPIGGDVLSEQHVRFTGAYYASRRSGPLLVIAEAAPVRGHPSATLLHQAAEVGAEFPAP